MDFQIPIKIKPKIYVKFREKNTEKSDKIVNQTDNNKTNLTKEKQNGSN